jgi:hypothetical protein
MSLKRELYPLRDFSMHRTLINIRDRGAVFDGQVAAVVVLAGVAVAAVDRLFDL